MPNQDWTSALQSRYDQGMSKSRLEAFSDGVIAIIITIMVLELKVPHEASFEALYQLWPVFVSYVLSFVHIGIYWNNHHHLLHAIQKVKGPVLWANLHLLFWLSLIPFTTAWMGENHFARLPVALYGLDLFMSGFAYFILVKSLLKTHPKDSAIAKAIGNGRKENISVALYITAIPLAFVSTFIALGIYAAVAVIWLIPDRRIENVLESNATH